jgi:Flp pilus assembly protein TadD
VVDRTIKKVLYPCLATLSLLTPPGGAGVMQELQPGDPEQVGPYRLVGRLGSGGMGRVFLGRSAGGRLVAVKVIRDDFAADQEFRARFGREVAAARQVGGLFTALVVDADVDGSVPWLATVYVAGPSLADAVNEHGSLPPASVLSLAAALAEGLSAIHAAGLVHRDLKPSNVLLADDGPRIIDFGISRAAEASVLTRTGLAVGTPGFMSPEQAEGGEVGPASDVFSLGGVLVFAATGVTPFGTGSTAALIYRVVHSPPMLDNVAPQVRPIVERCLAKDPGQRPTPSELLAEIGEVDLATDWLPTGVLERSAQHAPMDPASTRSSSQRTPTERVEVSAGTATAMTAPLKHLQEGDSLCHQGRYAGAETEYRLALAQDPQLARAHAGLGIALEEMNRDAEAEVPSREAIRLDPRLAIAHAGLGGALAGLKQYPEAEAECRTAIRLDPACVWAHKSLGIVLHTTERYPEAEEAYREAIRLNPSFAFAHLNLGSLLLQTARYPEAETEYREAIRLNPGHAGAHNGLGAALASTQRYREAEAAYRGAIRLNAGTGQMHSNLGRALEDMERYTEAEAEYREAIRLDPDNADEHRNRGRVLRLMKRYTEGEAEYREAIRLDPDNAETHYGLGINFEMSKKYPEAEAEYREAIRLDPSHTWARVYLGDVLLKTDRQSEAEATYREAIRLDPGNSSVHNKLGYFLIEVERFSEAEVACREAIRLDPGNSTAHNNLGWALKQTKRYSEAEAEYREAIRLNQDNSAARNNLKGLRKAQRPWHRGH